MTKNREKILCSGCLLGVECRYNGKSKPDKKVIELSRKEILIPVCPEQLGGLKTPREPAEQRGKGVFTKSGKNVTQNFKRGAMQILNLAKLFGVKKAILKQKSPSCGCGWIPDGTFSDRIIKGNGITASLLKKNRIKVFTEEDLE